jgi:membrane-associated protease RseP (regulator of RpoE activity)
MTRKRSVWLLGALLLALAVSGALFVQAQDRDRNDDEGRGEFRSVFISSIGGRARLGVSIREVTAEKARELKLPGEYGALVTEVTEDSPAAKAGLQEDDVILKFDGERVRSASHLIRLVRETPAGRSVTLQVSRGGQTRSLTAELEEREAHFRMPRIRIPEVDVRVMRPLGVFDRRPRLGITADDLTAQLADYFGVQQGEGVLVREVLTGTPAEKSGLKAGDVIVRVNDEEVGSVSQLRRALAEATREKEKLTVTVIRDRKQQALEVEIERPRRRAPRRSVEFLDLGPELEKLGAHIRAYAAEAQQFAEELQREWQDQWLERGEQWQQQWRQYEQNWQHQWKERQRELKRKLREELRLPEFREEISTRGVV